MCALRKRARSGNYNEVDDIDENDKNLDGWKSKLIKKTYYILTSGDYIVFSKISMLVGEVMTTVMHWSRNSHIEIACGNLRKHVNATFNELKKKQKIDDEFVHLREILKKVGWASINTFDSIYEFANLYCGAMEVEIQRSFADYEVPPLCFAAILGSVTRTKVFKLLTCIFRNKHWATHVYKRREPKLTSHELTPFIRTEAENKRHVREMITSYLYHASVIKGIHEFNATAEARGLTPKVIPSDSLPWNDANAHRLCGEGVGEHGTLLRKYAEYGTYSLIENNELHGLGIDDAVFSPIYNCVRPIKYAKNASDKSESMHHTLQKSVVRGYNSSLGLAMSRVGLSENKETLEDPKGGMRRSFEAYHAKMSKAGGGLRGAVKTFESLVLNTNLVQLAEEQRIIDCRKTSIYSTGIAKLAQSKGIYIPSLFLDDSALSNCRNPCQYDIQEQAIT